MSRNTLVPALRPAQVGSLPAEAQAFHRRARIVDAAVREIAARGHRGVTLDVIAERAGVSREEVETTFADTEDVLIWAYDAAAAYAVPRILRAFHAEPDRIRGAVAALGTYLAILDCDHDWALACLRDVPAAGDRARAAQDIVRAPVIRALEASLPADALVIGLDAALAAIDAVSVDVLRHDPRAALSERAEELARFVLGEFDAEPSGAPGLERVAPDGEQLADLIEAGDAPDAELELLVRAAAERRDGPALWSVVVALHEREGAGFAAPEKVKRIALEGLADAWFFGVLDDGSVVE
jgi:AcrR family transcriptional regulator